MVRISVSAALVVLAVLRPAPAARACTTVCMSRGKQVIVAKSYDFHVAHGLAVLNKRGVGKQSLTLTAKEKPARWVSKYGSVTFNQYGRELPLGGMNEKGLVVEIMWLNSTVHPPLDPERETINELQLIQYLLDTCATVKQALAALKPLQITRVHAKVHYMICDVRGRCATLEHLDGKRVIHAGRTLPVRVLTNNPYSESVRALRRHRGKKALPQGRASLARFVRAATHGRGFRKISKVHDVTRAFHILEDVQQGDFTKWQIVYEPTAGRVHFRGGSGDKQHTTVDLRRQEHGCEATVQVMDMLGTLDGKKGAVVPYSFELNRKLVLRSFKKLGARFPAPVLEQVARLPQSMPCTTKKPDAR